MPILNSRGDILAGIDGTVSLNAVPVPALAGITAGGWGFLSDDVIAGQALIGGAWALWSVDLHDPSGLYVLDPSNGANEFRAGGGEWLAYLTPPTVRGTLTKGTGDGRALYDIGRDGIGIVKPHQGADAGLAIVEPDSYLERPDDIFIASQDGLLLAATADGLVLTDLRDDYKRRVIPDLGVRGGRICRGRDGFVYQVYYWRGYTVVQRLDTYEGWIVRFSEFDFNPDVVAIGVNTLKVATAKHSGERPEDVQPYAIDLLTPPIDLRELWPPATMPPVEDVARVRRLMYVGPYQFTTIPPTGTARNVSLPIRMDLPPGRIVINIEGAPGVPDDQLAAIECAASTEYTLADRIRQSREMSRARRRPLYVYCDHGNGFIDEDAAALLLDTDWISWCMYWDANETAEARDSRYVAAIEHARKRWPDNPLAPVCGASTRGFLTVAQVAENIIVVSELAEMYPEIYAVPWFADGRGQGPSEHPELIPYLEAFVHGTLGAPPIVPIGPDPIPPVGLFVQKARFAHVLAD